MVCANSGPQPVPLTGNAATAYLESAYSLNYSKSCQEKLPRKQSHFTKKNTLLQTAAMMQRSVQIGGEMGTDFAVRANVHFSY